MKWCFLVNNFQYLPEFFGKLANEIIEKGDDCLVVFSSKIAEYDKKKFFPAETKFISVVDWNMLHNQSGRKDFLGLSWKDVFPFWERNPILNIDYGASMTAARQIVGFYEALFKEEKPDIIINELPTGLAHLVVYDLCQKNNAIYLALGNSRLTVDAIDVYDKKFTFSLYEKVFNEIDAENITPEEKSRAKIIIEKFVSHKLAPSSVAPSKIYLSQIGLILRFFKRVKETSSSLLPYFLSRKKFKFFDHESEMALKLAFRWFLNTERRKFKIIRHKKYFTDRSKEEKFFLFPLHYQPEAATDVYAIYYCDQLNTATNIAFSLPFPYKLYVKEHPVAVGTRRKEFYEKLKKIPNVVLISPEENMETLIKNSAGLVVLTGTAGLEAALSGKPVYVLGDVFYTYHPLCRNIKGFEQLKTAIEKDITRAPDAGGLEQINDRFITSYMRSTIPGNTTVASVGKDTNDYQLIYEGLLKLLVRIKK